MFAACVRLLIHHAHPLICRPEKSKNVYSNAARNGDANVGLPKTNKPNPLQFNKKMEFLAEAQSLQLCDNTKTNHLFYKEIISRQNDISNG